MAFEKNPMMLEADSEFMENIGYSLPENYSYLEVGVFFGASLPYQLCNPHCGHVTGVDLYPPTYPDERNKLHTRQPNFEKAIRYLDDRDIPHHHLETHQCDLGDLITSRKYDLILIDAEHTNRAAFRDAINAVSFMKPNAVIVFHDTSLVFGAIDCFKVHLEECGIQHRMFKIRDSELTAFVFGKMHLATRFCEEREADYEKFKINAKLRMSWELIATLNPNTYFDRK